MAAFGIRHQLDEQFKPKKSIEVVGEAILTLNKY